MELPPIMTHHQAPVSLPVQQKPTELHHDMIQVDVKRELTPVTIDLEQPDQGGSISGFEGLGQEMAFIDTSVTTSFDPDVNYEEEHYYEETLPHVPLADERVGLPPVCPLPRSRPPTLLLGPTSRRKPLTSDVSTFCSSCKDVFDRRANPLPCFDCNLWFHHKCRGRHTCDQN